MVNIWKPKIIDRYIVKKFLLTFFIALILIIGIVIIFDLSEKIDNFVKNEAPLKAIVFDYYVNFIPYFMNMFSPLFVFITVIFLTSRMAANTEIIAILSGGISYHRMMVPYLMSAGLVMLISLGLNLYVIPNANEERVAFEQKYNKARSYNGTRNVHYQVAPGQFVYIESFSNWNKTAYQMTIETIEDHKLVSKLTAETAAWDSVNACWKLRNYFIRDYTRGLQDRVRSGVQLDTTIALNIDDFYRNAETMETLPIGELNELIKTQKLRGDANVMLTQIEKTRRYALPFSALILTIIGVSLSSRKKRGGIGWNIGLGIALAFSYILFLRFSEMFVYTNTLPPGIALWLPNVLYAGIAAFLYVRAPK